MTGRLMVESDEVQLDEGDMPARQGRIAFAYLVLQRRRHVTRTELAQAIWGDDTPDAVDASLSALLSRLRRLFRRLALDLDIETLSGSVSLILPSDSWIDLEEARNAIDEAEGALREDQLSTAWSNAVVAFSIVERGFLHSEQLPWIVKEQAMLQADHARVLECLAEVSKRQGDAAAVLRYARKLSEIEPFRESAYEREMRAQMSLGNRAEALRVYERLRRLLADELGADPSPPLQAVYLEALGA